METETAKAVLGCTFETMYIQPLMLKWTYEKTISLKLFGKCHGENPGLLGLVGCLPVLYQACLSSKVSVAKILRLSMERAEVLLKEDPKIKIVHLVRDPRGILNSRANTGISRRYKTTPTEFCAYILRDLQASTVLLTRMKKCESM